MSITPLQDFYTDANAYLTGTTSTAKPALFQVRYNNIPGQTDPVQPLDVYYWGVYGQDEYQATKDLKVTARIAVRRSQFRCDLGLTTPMPTR
jgi:hypothetical protein